MIKTPLTLKNFIKSANKKNPIKILAICFKYISVKLISKRLKKSVDLHLVPSDFMQNLASDSLQLNPKKIKTFSHFAQ